MSINVGKGGRFRSNFTLTGFERNDPGPATLRAMLSLKDRMGALNKIMRRALEPMRKDMGSRAPVDTGALSESFRVRRLRKLPRNTLGWRVGAVSGEGVGVGGLGFQLAGWRDHFAELGTDHHEASPHVQPAIRANAARVEVNIRSEFFNFVDGLLRSE
jgi:HK97 gp10 family phage protein